MAICTSLSMFHYVLRGRVTEQLNNGVLTMVARSVGIGVESSFDQEHLIKSIVKFKPWKMARTNNAARRKANPKFV